jgi:hypothetical protein
MVLEAATLLLISIRVLHIWPKSWTIKNVTQQALLLLVELAIQNQSDGRLEEN